MDDEKRAEDIYKMEALMAEGYCCSQIIMKMALDQRGVINEEMLDAVSALCNGLKTGNNCGSLTAAALVLAMADKRMSGITVMALVDWFKKTYGSLDCFDIIGKNRERLAELCPSIIHESYFKAMDILKEYNLSLLN